MVYRQDEASKIHRMRKNKRTKERSTKILTKKTIYTQMQTEMIGCNRRTLYAKKQSSMTESICIGKSAVVVWLQYRQCKDCLSICRFVASRNLSNSFKSLLLNPVNQLNDANALHCMDAQKHDWSLPNDKRHVVPLVRNQSHMLSVKCDRLTWRSANVAQTVSATWNSSSNVKERCCSLSLPEVTIHSVTTLITNCTAMHQQSPRSLVPRAVRKAVGQTR